MKNLILSLAHPDGGKTFVIYKTKTKQATLNRFCKQKEKWVSPHLEMSLKLEWKRKEQEPNWPGGWEQRDPTGSQKIHLCPASGHQICRLKNLIWKKKKTQLLISFSFNNNDIQRELKLTIILNITVDLISFLQGFSLCTDPFTDDMVPPCARQPPGLCHNFS